MKKKRSNKNNYRDDLFLKLIKILWSYNDEELKDIADKAQVHWTTLYNWKSARIMNPHINNMVRVAAACGHEFVLVAKSERAKIRRIA